LGYISSMHADMHTFFGLYISRYAKLQYGNPVHEIELTAFLPLSLSM
jgi:hypothetical protein